MLSGHPPRFQRDPNPSLLSLLELFDEPIPDVPGVPTELVDVLRMGMANDPLARPTAGRLRDLLRELPLQSPPPRVIRASAPVPPPRRVQPPVV